MRKRLLCLLLCLALLLSIVPAVSAAEVSPEVSEEISLPMENILPANTIAVGGVVLRNGDYLASNASAAVRTKPSGGYAYWNNGILTLHNYRYTGAGYIYQGVGSKCSSVIYAENGFTLRLEGTNNLTNTKAGSDGITLEANANVTINGGGTLQINADYGIYTTWSGNLILNNVKLKIQADGFGIRSDMDITATDSRLEIVCNDTGIVCYTLTLIDTTVVCHTPGYGLVTQGGQVYPNANVQVLYPRGGKIQPLTSVGGTTRWTVTDKDNQPAPVLYLGAPFKDVTRGSFYEDAVYIALVNGITTGTGGNAFSPAKACTRGEAVTFLWRALDNPTPDSTASKFSDTVPGRYYYNAMLWAVDNGVTVGTGGGRFSPNNTCTRAEIVTFLWRAAGKPAPISTKCPFRDVTAGSFYYEAMLWAVDYGITTGTSATTFSPNSPCSRAEVVTFLYRWMRGPAE